MLPAAWLAAMTFTRAASSLAWHADGVALACSSAITAASRPSPASTISKSDRGLWVLTIQAPLGSVVYEHHRGPRGESVLTI
jgi:hypothetical protein